MLRSFFLIPFLLFSTKWVLKRIPPPPRKWQAFLHKFLFIVQDFFVQCKTGVPIWERRSSACPKPRRVCARRRKESPIIFFGNMCGEENTSQAASVEFVRRRRTNYARGRLQSPCQKGILFDSLRAGVPIWERRSCKKCVCAYASSCCVTHAICASTLGTDVPP